MASATSRRALWLQKIAHQVAHALSERIASGALSEGDSPGNREALASEFVTSVSVIDRAFEEMAEKGVLIQGSQGYEVAGGVPRDHGFEVPHHETLSDVLAILEMRLGLESVGAALAAERHDADELARIREAAEAYERAVGAGAAPSQADFQFHSAIAAAAGNPYLSDLLDYLGPLLIPRMRLALASAPGTDQRGNSVDEHARILTAIEARDTDAARRAMREHLTRTLKMVQAEQG